MAVNLFSLRLSQVDSARTLIIALVAVATGCTFVTEGSANAQRETVFDVAPCPAPVPAVDDAIDKLFGSDAPSGTLGLAENEEASLWFVQCFLVRGESKAAMFIQSSSGWESPDYKGASISVVVYRFSGNQWVLESRQSRIGEAGNRGKAPKIDRAQVVALSSRVIGFLTDDGFCCNGGESTLGKMVFAYDGKDWRSLGFVQTGGENSGAMQCDESAKDSAGSGCYDYSGIVTVESGQGGQYFNLLVEERGRIPSEGGTFVSQRSVRYAFDGKKYSAASGG